jgi:hypothetical protein
MLRILHHSGGAYTLIWFFLLWVQALQSYTSDGGSDAAAAAGQPSIEEELDDFGMSGWGQFGGEDAVLQEQPAAKPKRKLSAAAKVSSQAGGNRGAACCHMRLPWQHGLERGPCKAAAAI